MRTDPSCNLHSAQDTVRIHASPWRSRSCVFTKASSDHSRSCGPHLVCLWFTLEAWPRSLSITQFYFHHCFRGVLPSHLLLCFFGRTNVLKKKSSQSMISSCLPTYKYTCVLCTHIRIHLYEYTWWDSVRLYSSGPSGVSSQTLGSHPRTPCAVCVCVCTHIYTHTLPHMRVCVIFFQTGAFCSCHCSHLSTHFPVSSADRSASSFQQSYSVVDYFLWSNKSNINQTEHFSMPSADSS